MRKTAVVIPAYKVEKQILDVIKNIPDFIEFIIVVNDCSPDNTLNLVMSLTDKRLHVLSHLKNEGVGGAMLTGYSYALNLGAEIVIKIDGDGQMDPGYIPQLIYFIENGYADYTKGNRFLHNKELRRMPKPRLIGNIFLSFLTKLASGYWNIFDPTNGFSAISKEMLLNLDPYRIRNDYFFESSMLCELRYLDAVIEDVPIPAIYSDENSSLVILKEVFNFSLNLFQRFIRRIFFQYFLVDFSATSAFIIAGSLFGIFGFIWGITAWTKSANSGIPATTGTVLIAALSIILSAQLVIQAIALDINSTPTKKYIQKATPEINQANLKGLSGYFDKQLEFKQVRLEKEINR